jgi:hypothetical protein
MNGDCLPVKFRKLVSSKEFWIGVLVGAILTFFASRVLHLF